jgi:hypothetical protein
MPQAIEPTAPDPTAQELADAYRGGCPDCLAIGSQWVHLRMCLVCRHVGCCDNSPRRHARLHWQTTGHAEIVSLEPGETWRWSFATEQPIE